MSQDPQASGQSPGRYAVIGMGCRLPGGADSPSALWRLLADGRDVLGAPPADRPELLPPAGRPSCAGPAPVRGGFLTGLARFDAAFFGVPEPLADLLDPRHRMLLEVAWEALEHAGIAPERLDGTSTAVFTGLTGEEPPARAPGGGPRSGRPEGAPGGLPAGGASFAAGRISARLGLRGPAIAVDTDSSSSLLAVHLACQALAAGECDLALAGGAALLPRRCRRLPCATGGCTAGAGTPGTTCRACGGRVGDGCRDRGGAVGQGRASDDCAAECCPQRTGRVPGEGCGAVVLKRLADARRDGDRVLAVLLGSAAGHDGGCGTAAASAVTARQAVLREALARAGIAPDTVGMLETDGPGAFPGGAAEVAALSAVYGSGVHRCALGSVGARLGDLEAAAGITGLIKAVLCLRHGLALPGLPAGRPHPAGDAAGSRFFTPAGTSRWPVPGVPRRAAVCSFGLSGTCVHAVLEQAPPPVQRRIPRPRQAARSAPQVFVVPAGSAVALPAAARRLADWLESDGAAVPLRDVAHTLALRRSAGRGRLAVTAASRGELVGLLRAFGAGDVSPAVAAGSVEAPVPRRPVWVFGEQGPYPPGLGRGMLAQDPVFAEALAAADALVFVEAGFSVLESLRDSERPARPDRVQPMLFALQTALAAAWRAHGVEPAAVLGCGLGEAAAAVAAGALSLTDGVRVVCRASALIAEVAGSAARVALAASAVRAELAEQGLAESVSLAVEAAPGSSLVAGDTEAVRGLVDRWRRRGVDAALEPEPDAAHSPLMEPLQARLRDRLADLAPREPRVPLYSTVLDDPRGLPAFDAGYWAANLRRPVRLAAAVEAAAADRRGLFVELAPHPVAGPAVDRAAAGSEHRPLVLPTLRGGTDETAAFRLGLAALHCAGVAVDWSRLYGDGELADVPTTLFDRRPHPRAAQRGHQAGGSAAGPLPGRRTEVPGDPPRLCWQGDTGTAVLPWLADHRAHGSPVLPAAACHALALTAACEAFGAEPEQVEIVELRCRQPLPLADRTEIGTVVVLDSPDRAECEIHGRGPDGTWVRLADAVLHRLPPPAGTRSAGIGPLARRHPVRLDPADLYRDLRAGGMEYGPAFAGIDELYASRGGESLWARVRVPEAARTPPSGLRIHPVLLDLCVQSAAAALPVSGSGAVRAAAVQVVRVLGDPAAAAFCHVRVSELGGGGLTGQARLMDESGRAVLAVDGLRLVRTAPRDADRIDERFLQIRRRPAVRPLPVPGGTPGDWLVVGEADGSACYLAEALRAAGATAEAWDTALGDEPLTRLRERIAERLADRRHPPRGVVVLCAARSGGSPVRDGLRRVRRLVAAAQAVGTAGGSRPPRLYAVTRGARPAAPGESGDPGQAALRGVVRVLACEHPALRATCVDAAAGGSAAADLAAELLSDAADDEVVLRDGSRRAARLEYAPLTAAERAAAAGRPVSYRSDGFRLRAAPPGGLDRIEPVATGRRVPERGEVEVRVAAAGVSFRDVLAARGLLGEGAGLGLECAGVVTAVGQDAGPLRVGDRVLALDLRGGAFGPFTTVPATAVAPVPEGLDMVAAAGLPLAFTTAWYALRRVAGLRSGERVLVHSATGGVGLASVAVARLLGAEVLATAGSEERRRYLHGLGISTVMDSRTPDFRGQALAATGGAGVDVVLGGLSGAAVRAGLEALGPFGRFVDLGLRGAGSGLPPGPGPLRPNTSFAAVDLAEVQRTRPEVLAECLREVLAEFTAGRLRPLYCTAYPLSRAAEALRSMAEARHPGKLVLTVPDEGEVRAVLPDGPRIVRPDGAYLVAGGLHGPGLAIACALARRGASHLVLGGPSGPSAAASQVLGELTAAGTRISLVIGDLSAPGVAEQLAAAAASGGGRLRGVVHCTVPRQSVPVRSTGDEVLDRIWAERVAGVWRLHRATADCGQDWFAVFCSPAAALGSPGRAADAAADAWLEGFAAWRSALGQPALAVGWVPRAPEQPDDRRTRQAAGAEALEALEALLAHRREQALVATGDPDTWLPAAARRSPFFQGLVAQPTAASGGPRPAGGVRARLLALPAGAARRKALEDAVAEMWADVLRRGAAPPEPGAAPDALRLDAPAAEELRQRLEAEFGLSVGPGLLRRHRTAAALAAALAELLDGLSDP